MASPPTDDDRCEKKDGKGWRCRLPRFGGNRYCEKHHLDYLRRYPNSQSLSRVRVSVPSFEKKKKKMPLKKKRFDSSEEEEEEYLSTEDEEEEDWSTEEEEDSSSSEIKKKKKPSRVRVSDPLVEKKKRGRPRKTKEMEGISSVRISDCPVEKMMPMRAEEEAIGVLELGQVWAFSEESDGFPRSYARIDRIVQTQSSVQVTPLVPYPVSREEILISEQGISLACGLFRASAESSRIKKVSTFTHNVRFEKEGRRGSLYRVFPRKGEIWAVYLKWDDLKKRFEYNLVEIVSDFNEEDGVNVFGLVRVEGKAGVYRRKVHEGFHLVRSCSRSFMPMFSHQVPASRVEEGGDMVWKVMLH